MVQDRFEFEARLKRLVHKHTNMSRGYRTTMRPDGLIVVKPRRKRSPISLASVVIFLAAFFVFKGFLIANLGPAAYDDRVADLSGGTMVEQAGAVLMQADPLANMIAQKMGPILR